MKHWRPQRSQQLFPRLEATPDFNRGEIRLAGEVALAELNGDPIPGDAVNRAVNILTVMARG
jgi:hypothetical protein